MEAKCDAGKFNSPEEIGDWIKNKTVNVMGWKSELKISCGTRASLSLLLITFHSNEIYTCLIAVKQRL